MNRELMQNTLGLMEKIISGQNRIIRGDDYFVKSEDSEFSLQVLVPGYKTEDISVEVDGNFLSIKGNNNDSYWTEEFNKKFTLPSTVDKDSISAKIEDGVLKISIGKKKESLPKKIKIG